MDKFFFPYFLVLLYVADEASKCRWFTFFVVRRVFGKEEHMIDCGENCADAAAVEYPQAKEYVQ